MNDTTRRLRIWLHLLFFAEFFVCSHALASPAQRSRHQNQRRPTGSSSPAAEIDVLSKAIGFLYKQGGTLHVLERSDGLEHYSGSSLVAASIKASNGHKGQASGILNALLGSCCVNARPEKALEIMQAYDELDFLQPDLVALCLCYTALESTQTHREEAGRFLSRAENLYKNDIAQPQTSSSDVNWHELQLDHGIQLLQDNAEFVVLSKPSGMVCYHPHSSRDERSKKRARRHDPSLEECLLNSGLSLSTLNKEGRGMVHRIDRGTSGCIVLAKTNHQHATLLSQFFVRHVQKSYQALICCNRQQRKLPPRGTISLDIDGRPASSSYEVETVLGGGYCRLRMRTKQGRRHQIRIHCSKGLQAPILLDPLYNGQASMKSLLRDEYLKTTLPKLRSSQRFCLHADSLCLPQLGIDCRAPLPIWWLDLEHGLSNMDTSRTT